MGIREIITAGEAVLGIELGSTRIKAVLIDAEHNVIGTGGFHWENQYIDGIWTYDLKDVWRGIQESYRELSDNVYKESGVRIHKLAGIGFSAMMHGYLAFDENFKQLVPFRTWRNTTTSRASKILSERFNFNIPQRWSIAHLYQAMLDEEEHLPRLDYITTLAGYVHTSLTGLRVLGVGDCSGMFPIDDVTCGYDERMIREFDKLSDELGYALRVERMLPRVLCAGESAGELTAEGARLIDPSGSLLPGILMCPPEGDAGTGMTATNSTAPGTGNISAGTSVFAMIVLERALSGVYEEIDIVTTPTGAPVSMVHCNNCTSDIDAWAGLLCESVNALGYSVTVPDVLGLLFSSACKGDETCDILSYNYYSGEPITGLIEGRPLLVRSPGGKLSVANFAQSLLFSSVATLRLGLNILIERERVLVSRIYGHGGYFKSRPSGPCLMASALNVPVSVMSTAGEGGAWGMAILAAFSAYKTSGQSLEQYLEDRVFSATECETYDCDSAIASRFNKFLNTYERGLAVERCAAETLWK